MQIQCRSCRAKVAVEDINLERMLAKCRACQSVFDISDQVPSPGASGLPRPDKALIPLPRTLRVEDAGAALSITRLWVRGAGFFLLAFSLFWDLIVSVVAGGTLFHPSAGTLGPFPGFLWVFFTPFFLVGAITLYLALALLTNRTTLRVEDGRISVRHAPFPWPGQRNLPTEDLTQLFCTKYISHTTNNVPQFRFAVWGLWRDGRREKIVSGIGDLEQAYFIENAVEKHLRIEDAPVEGEYGT